MKWYDAKKHKPQSGVEVMAYPCRPYPLIFWDKDKQAWYHRSPTYCYPVGPFYTKQIEQWAYIDFPKRSLWQRILKKLKNLNFRSKG
jgi:hypothetical protein